MTSFHIQRADRSKQHVGGYKEKHKPGASQFEPTLSPDELPPSVDLRAHLTPIEDQGDTNSCVANATAGAFEYLLKQHTGSNHDVSRMFIYYNARKLESDDVEDEGTAIHDAVDSLKEYGVCPEDVWPFDKRHVNSKPHSKAYDQAKDSEVDGLDQVSTDLDQWRHCLAEGRPIIFGVKLFDSFDKARKGKVPMPTDREKQRGKHGRHAMLCVGYSDSDELFIVRNSWGTDWGDDGYCYIPYDYLMSDEYNSGDSWVIRHVNGSGEPDRSTWGDDTSILPALGDAELHKMDDDEYQAMLEELGDVPLESRVALLYLVAAGSDGLSDEETQAIADEVQRMHDALGSSLDARKVIDFATRHVRDEKLIDDTIVLLGTYLSKGLLASLLQSMRTIAGADGIGEDEQAFIDEVTEVWEVGSGDSDDDSEDDDSDDEDSDEDESDDDDSDDDDSDDDDSDDDDDDDSDEDDEDSDDEDDKG